MPRKAALLLFTILAVAQFVATAAVAEPSFEETRDWIIDKIGKNTPYELGFGKGKTVHETINVDIAPCSIRYQYVHSTIYYGGPNYRTANDFAIESADIQHTTYSAGQGEIEAKMNVSAYNESIVWTMRSLDRSVSSTSQKIHTTVHRSNGAGFTIDFGSEENLGERMARALTHLGKLAQANPDCPRHPRPKEVKQVF